MNRGYGYASGSTPGFLFFREVQQDKGSPRCSGGAVAGSHASVSPQQSHGCRFLLLPTLDGFQPFQPS